MSLAPFSNLAYMELLYSRYQRDPQSVPAEWRRYFTETVDEKKNGNGDSKPSFTPRSIFNPATLAAPTEFKPDTRTAGVQERLYEMIRNHRVRGHMIAQVDPLGSARPVMLELELDFYGFSETELDTPISSATLPYNTPLTIREIYQRMRNTYCRSIGAQFMHI